MSSLNVGFEIEVTKLAIQDQKVSHILHLILSVITMGLWVVIWLIVTASASMERNRLKTQLKRLMINDICRNYKG